MNERSITFEEQLSGLSQQLDEIANEASLLNSDSPTEMSPVEFMIGNSTSPYSPIPEDRASLASSSSLPYDNPIEFEQPYVMQCIRKWLGKKTSTPEQEPLLPTHGSNETPLSPQLTGTPQIPPSYITAFMEFVWNYIFTETMREYLEVHRIFIYLMVVAVFAVIGVILYYNNQLGLLIIYLRMMVCYLFSLRVGDGPSPAFCPA